MKPARIAAAMAAALLLLGVYSSLGETRPPGGQPLLPGERRHLPPGAALRVLHAPPSLQLLSGAGEGGEAPSPHLALAQEIVFAETSSSERFSQLQQASAALTGGGFAVVWEAGSYPSRDVRMQWLDAEGSFVFPPGGLLAAGSAADESNAVIVAHPTDGVYVAFTVGPSSSYVRVQRFDGNGAPRWPGAGVVAGLVDSSHFATDPHVVANPSGGVFVCFETFGQGYDLRCQLIDESGSLLWGASGRSVGVGAGWSEEWRVLPRGLSDGAGGLLVFWRNQRNPFAPVLEPMLMEGQRFASDGARLWGEAPKVLRTTGLASSNGHGFDFYQAVTDGAGGAILAFDDWLGASPPELDVVAQRISGSGELLWGGGAVVTGASGQQQHGQTIAGPDGGAFVAVLDVVSSTLTRSRLFRLGAEGTHLWTDQGILLSDPRATALDYGVDGSFDDGVLRLAWTHQHVALGQEFDVQFAGMTAQGERWGGAGGIPLTAAPYQQFSRELVYSREYGGLLAVWDDRRKNDWNDLDVFGATLKDAAWRANGRFFTLTPCRLLDTRNPVGPHGGPPLASSQTRVVVAAEACGIPASARAIAVNLTAVSPSSEGYLTAYPSDWPRPVASTLNLRTGQTRANNAIVRLSWDGAFAVFSSRADGGTTHLVVDVAGYFD